MGSHLEKVINSIINKSRAPFQSQLYLPKLERPPATIFEYLITKFPHLGYDTLAARILDSAICFANGKPITLSTPYQYGIKVFYYRESEVEPEIEYQEKIIFQNEDILIVDKPHFLPVTPSGKYINQCLLSRLVNKYGSNSFTPIHRLDRETAGLVLFSTNKRTRHLYHKLFQNGKVTKQYYAMCYVNGEQIDREWMVSNRIVAGEPWYRMKIVPGSANAITHIQLLDYKEGKGLFVLIPITGKKHQLRLHLTMLGFSIINDSLYPEIEPIERNYLHPLQLLAYRLLFQDPITGDNFDFTSNQKLALHNAFSDDNLAPI